MEMVKVNEKGGGLFETMVRKCRVGKLGGNKRGILEEWEVGLLTDSRRSVDGG